MNNLEALIYSQVVAVDGAEVYPPSSLAKILVNLFTYIITK